MTATFANAPTSNRVTASPLLRGVLMVDGVATAGTGALLIGFAGLLDELLGISAGLLVAAGAFFLLYGAAVLSVGARKAPRRAAVIGVLVGNLAYVLDSVVTLEAGWFGPTTLGAVGIGALAAVVAGFAAVELYAYRRA